MFRNKVDVDRHVVKTLAKVKSEKDRNFRAYSFARLYFDVGDFESCVKYVEMYLSVKDNNPAAHTLLGQAFQKLGQFERALAAYKTSLGLDLNQNNLILKVCELLGSEDHPLEAGSARYWEERGTAAFPDHPALFTLRQRLLTLRGAPAPATLALMHAEAGARPRDPAPHARLLRHLVSESPNEAFKFAFQIGDRFSDSNVWNEAVVEALESHNELGWEHWLLKLTVLERLAELSFAGGRRHTDAAAAVWKLDRALYSVAETIVSVAPSRTLGAEAISHFGAQLCLLLATLILKKAWMDGSDWREAVKAAGPSLLLAMQPPMPHRAPPVPSPMSATYSSERLLASWYVSAAYRRSQAGHTILACAKDKKNVFLEKVSQYCSGAHWRDKLYRKAFINKEHLEKLSASFLFTNSSLAEVVLTLPKLQDLKHADRVAALFRPNSLHHQAWLGCNGNLSEVSCVGVDELRVSVNNLSNCGAETLNKLDLDTFLYCTIITAKKNTDTEYKSGYWDNDEPKVLPAILTPQLCTPAQSKWWEAACKVKGTIGGDLSDIRLTLTRGIETVRCVGSHGLDPKLLIEVARAFSKRADLTSDPTLRKFLEARANLCYSAGVPLLERIRNNISIRPPEKRLFEYTHGELPQDKLEALIEEGKLYLALQCVSDKNDDKAIEILETVESPYASFHLYNIFKRLADDITSERERIDPANRSRRAVYLTKARDYVYLTTERLKAMRADSDHPLYCELGNQIQSIDLSLSRMEPADLILADNNIYSSEEESWIGDSIPGNVYMKNLTPRSNRSKGRTRPFDVSSDNIESQIRQLQKKNSVMSNFIEQTKVLVESNRTLVEEVREMKKALGEIKSHNIEDTLDQFKGLRLSVEEVKCKINEYRDESAADVADLKKEITELKNELGKIKNSPVERAQVDDNELYMLEEEAGAYLQRQQPPPVLPAQAYPIYPPGALYPLYGQYPGVPQLFPGALFQDQPLYSELLAQRSLPAPQPLVAPPTAATFPPPPVPAIPRSPVHVPAPVIPSVLAAPPVHDYHIPLPQRTTSFPTTTSTSTPNKPFPTTAVPEASNTPKFSLFDSPKPAITDASKPFSFLGSPGTFDYSQNQSANKSRTLSERSTDSYDPIPDFKPIINLPDEVPLMTGEEGEEVLFDARAKLFRFVSKEWKERGLGHIKLLKNDLTGKVRVLMRRERVHTICANHIITPEIEINPMKDREKAYIWGANDFADQTVQYEMFCIRFKTVETGNEFYEKFCIAITESAALNSSGNTPVKDTAKNEEVKEPKNEATQPSAELSVGGLKFFNTPTFKTVPDVPVTVASAPEPAKVNPFAGFTFNKTTTSSTNLNSFATIQEPAKAEAKPPKSVIVSPNENVLYESCVKVSMTEKNSMVYKDKGDCRVKIVSSKKDAKKLKMTVSQDNGTVLCNIPLNKELKYDELMLQPNTLIITLAEAVLVRIKYPSIEMYQKFKTVSSTCNAVEDVKSTENTTDTKTEKVVNKKSEKKQEKAAPSAEPNIPTTVSGWGDKFKPKAGSWDCSLCYINNAATADYCVACNTPKDPSMPKKEEKPAAPAPSHSFTFGIPATNGAAAPTFGIQQPVEKPPMAFTFGMPSVEKPAEIAAPVKNVSFADAAANSTFGFPQKNKFSFSMKPKSPVKENASHDKSHDSDNEYAAEDEGEHIVFTPIIPLPDVVEVKTGEEEEEILYKHLAKLYRFASSEWKECGVGDIKILRHPDTGKVRVLMRREPIHKICLNHALIADIKYMPKDEKTWLFSANDFSSGEITPTQFCIRFKTHDIAVEFLAAIDKARADLPMADTSLNLSAKAPSDDEDVVFVAESKVTEDDKELAKKYLLPENFYAYKQKAPCKGCVGCNADEYVFKSPVVITVTESTTKPDTSAIKSNTSTVTAVKVEEIANKKVEEKADKKVEEKADKNVEVVLTEALKKVEKKTFVFGQQPSVVPVTSASPVSVFSAPSTVFGGTSIFSGKQPEGPILAVPKFTPSTDSSPASIFGGQPLFSSSVFSAKNTSVFGNSPAKPEENKAPGSVIAAPTFSFSGNADNSNVFGTKDSNSIFKVPNPAATPVPTQASLLFGNAVKNQQNLFTPAPLFSGQPTPLFSAQPTGGGIFGGKVPEPAKPALIFGQSNAALFGGTGQKVIGENGEKEAPAAILKSVNSDLTFSALAAKNAETPAFLSNKESGDKPKAFNWAGAGTPLFGGARAGGPPRDKNDSHGEGEEGAEAEEYDPHYEPVVPMPDEINVVTGEEDERVEFEQNVKLFRFTDTEWKERGIGSFRLLFHPQRRTYRLLMRQSQVHKVVLNQLITRDLQLMPMARSERAFMWAGLNYTEDSPSGELEKLAVRFSNQNQARDFSDRVAAIITELKQRAEQEGAREEAEDYEEEHETVEEDNENGELGKRGDQEEAEDKYEDYEEGHETDDEDNENAEEVIFESQAMCRGLDCQVVLLSAPEGGFIRLYCEKDVLSEIIVGPGAHMKRDGVVCSWWGAHDVEEDAETIELPDMDTAAELQEYFNNLAEYNT